MNALKNMEIIFVVAAALAGAASYATASVPVVEVANTAFAKAPDSTMAVVVVSAKRLSAAEKAALI